MAYGKILDIGCSGGEMFGEGAVNVDLGKYGGNIGKHIPNFVLADVLNLPFKNHVFNCAVMSELLEHLDDPKKALEEAQRVAEVVILTVPNEHEWHPKMNPFHHPTHKQLFTEKSLLKLVYESGLQLIVFIKVNWMGWSHFLVKGVSNDIQINIQGAAHVYAKRNGDVKD